MSKVSKKLAALVFAAVLAMALLVGCGSTPAIVGTWKAATVEASGVSMDFDAFAKQLGGDADSVKIEMVAKEDKTFSMTLMDQSQDGTWAEKDGKFVLTADEEDLEVQIEDGKLIIAEDSMGVKITFEKK